MAHLAPVAAFEAQNIPEWMLMPWERGFLGVVFGTRPLIELPLFQEGGPAELRAPPLQAPDPAPKGADGVEPDVTEEWEPGRVFVRVPIQRAKVRWARDRPDERGLAIARWRWLAEVAGRRSKLYRQGWRHRRARRSVW